MSYLEGNVGVFVHAEDFWLINQWQTLYVLSEVIQFGR